MANTGQLGTIYSQLGGIILGTSDSGDNSVKQHGQAQSQIVSFDVQKYAQSQSQILSEYQAYGQAEVIITHLITYQAYAQADSQIVYVYTYSAVSNSLSQILTTYNEIGQAQADILQVYQAYGQAGFILQIPGPVKYFYDSFTRTTTAPPFNVGNADTGTPWVFNTWDSSETESLTPLHVDGSALVHEIPSGQTYSSMHNIGASIDDGELLIDIWMAAAGDNGAYTYWYDNHWNIYTRNSDTTDDTTFYFRSRYSVDWIAVPNAITTRSAWYRLRVIINSAGPEYIKAHIWKIGDTEPVTWTVVQDTWLPTDYINWTGDSALPAMLDIYETPYNEAAKFDNITVTGYSYTVYNQGFGNAQVSICDTKGYAQAQAQIKSIDYPQWAQAQAWTVYRGEGGEYIWPQYGQSNVYITDAKDQPVHGQALAWIALTEIVTLFYDSFSRVISGDTWGNPDIGSPTYDNSISSYYDGVMSVDGSKGLITVPANDWSDGKDFKFGANFYNFEMYFEVKLTAENDPGANLSSYYIIRDTGTGTSYWNTGAYYYIEDYYARLRANYGSNSIVRYDLPYNPQVINAIKIKAEENTVYAKFWPITDSEPDWQLTLVLTDSHDLVPGFMMWEPYANHDATSQYPMVIEFDNLVITGYGPMLYNLGRGQAQAQVNAFNVQAYSQALALLNQYYQLGQSQTSILTSYQKYAQAQSKILKSAGYANAQTYIKWPDDSYRDMVYADGATHYYGMRTSNAYPNSDYTSFKDELNTQNSNAPYYATYSTTVTSPMGPEYLGVTLGYYLAYRGWSSALSPSTAQILEFAASTWSYDGWVKAPSASPALATIFGLYLQSSYHYFDIYFGSTTSEDTSGTKIAVMAYNSGESMTYYDTGVTFVPNAWYHIAVTYINKVFKVYINSVLTNTITRSAWNPTGSTNVFYMGYSSYFGSGGTYVGGYDNLAIYPITLSQEVITNHYIEGPNTQFVYSQTQGKINSFGWTEYGQALAILNTGFALAQADAKLNSFGWNEYGQANAKLNSFDQQVYAQTQTMVIPRHGLLKYFIQGSVADYALPDTGTYSQITSISADTDVGQINLGDFGSNYGIRWQAWFIADRTGAWYFKTTSDDGSGVYIYNEQNQLVGSMWNGYPGGMSTTTRDSDTSPNTRINLVEGQKYKIDVKYAEGGGGAIIQVWYRRPDDTADIWLLDGLAPWNDKDRYRRFAQANALYVYRGPGGEYIWPQFAQAQARMVYTGLTRYAQTQTQIGGFQYGQAIAQIINTTDAYELAVLADDPLFYYRMDETVYTQGLFSIVGRRGLAAWDASGASFGQSPALLSGTSIDFNGRAATVELPVTGRTVQETLSIPGTQMSFNSMWKLSSAFWLNAGESVTISVQNLYNNGANISLGIWGMRTSDNQYAYIGTNPTGTYTRTATQYDIYFVYIYPQSGAPVVPPTGSGTFIRPEKGESLLAMEYGSPTTVEGWFKWGGSNEDMIFGFNANDLFIYGASAGTAYIGFNDAAGHQYGTATRDIVSGRWYHFAAIFYNGQPASTSNKLYIDGVQKTLSGSSLATRYIDQKFVLGGWISNTSYQWDGNLDAVALYNYALTAEQVLTHYRARINLWNAQAQARIYSFGYPQWAQAQTQIGGFQYGLALAKLIPDRKFGQAQAVIYDGYGLLRTTWLTDGSTFTWGTPYSWDNENAPGQPNYDGSNHPSSWVRDGNWGMAWYGKFVADVSGTWQFQIYHDDGADLWINDTRVVNGGFPGGNSPTTHSGSIVLTQGTSYTLVSNWVQGGGGWVVRIQYKRPEDSDWYYLTDNTPPWIKQRYSRYAQAQAEILPTPFEQQFAQAQAQIIAFKVKAYAQAQAQVLTTYRKYAQAGTQFGHWQYGLSRTKVLRMYQAYAQALTQFGHWQYGLSKAHIRAFDIRKYGQAQAYIVRSTHGQAQGHIKQTYPLFSLNNYALTNLGASASAYPPESTIEGPVSNIFDQFIYTVWTNALLPVVTSTVNPTVDDDLDHGFYEGQNWINTVTQVKFILVDGTPGAAVWEVTTVTNTYLQIDLGVARTVNAYAILPVKYNATVTIAHSNNGTSWTNAITDIFFDVYISNPASYEDLIQGFLPQIVSARYWRIIVQNGGDDNGISLGTLQLGFATIVNPTFAQAQAQIGHFQLGISGALIHRNEGYALAKALIIQTYQKYSQADSWIIPPYGSGLAQAQVLQTYSEIANANAWIIPPTEIGQAEASIKVFGINRVGLARTHILVFEAYTANARAKIVYPQGYGQANVHILSFNNRQRGGAIAYVGHIKLANAHAFIVKTKLYAQSQAQILKLNNGKYGQALCWIDRSERFANARATILTTYRKYGQAGAILNTGFGLAQAKTLILRTYERFGNTRAHIKRTYEQLAQAQLSIYWRIKALGQARVMVVKQRTGAGLAMAQVGGFNYGQAQAYLWAFNVPKVGNACGYILASTDIVPSPPTSGMATYLVMFNGQTLPGYAQSESYDSLMSITDHYAAYLDSSLSEYTGLQNKSIELVMLVWEPTYFQCKIKVQEAATILRSARKRFVKMYIQHRDKYYLVMPKTISMSKSVGESTQILPYTITFEAKPWLIENAVNAISGTGTIDTGTRPLTNGGWTPTTILVSGTDVIISGITETGQDTGTVSLEGTVSNFVIDSEAFTSTDNSIITPKNYGIYVGPGKTTFTITGATSCIIQWQNRYYL